VPIAGEGAQEFNPCMPTPEQRCGACESLQRWGLRWMFAQLGAVCRLIYSVVVPGPRTATWNMFDYYYLSLF